LKQVVETILGKTGKEEKLLMMELVLHGLSEFSQLSKLGVEKGVEFKDLMSGMFEMKQGRTDEDYGGYYEEK
jgi:magnesium chelatase subunit I